MLQVIAKSIAKDDKIEETKKALEALVNPTRKEDGCIKYELFQDIDHPEVFVFSEEWESKTKLEVHLKQPHLVNWAELSKTLLKEPMEVSLLEKLA
ncbi:putative quinol monooxygenase [Chishuiella sp.]|uniref:putative quinol monooxygenase n=1 Tax=Chishuiella sp. TaxID=1969467 RepID=UPI0028AE3C18|nr:putative quinol monooxygenase [Chishuiella sp.]